MTITDVSIWRFLDFITESSWITRLAAALWRKVPALPYVLTRRALALPVGYSIDGDLVIAESVYNGAISLNDVPLDALSMSVAQEAELAMIVIAARRRYRCPEIYPYERLHPAESDRAVAFRLVRGVGPLAHLMRTREISRIVFIRHLLVGMQKHGHPRIEPAFLRQLLQLIAARARQRVGGMR